MRPTIEYESWKETTAKIGKETLYTPTLIKYRNVLIHVTRKIDLPDGDPNILTWYLNLELVNNLYLS